MLAYVANVIFLAYLVLIASVDANPALIAAVTFEVLFFGVLVLYRIRRGKAVSALQAKAALEYIEQNRRFVYKLRRGFYLLSSAVLFCACLYLACDFAALALARFGQLELSARLYKVLAPPQRLAVHPGFSLELLTGAYIDSKNYEAAQQLESALLSIRKSVVGDEHELIAAMYANLGDFYAKWGRGQLAEDYYRRSIDLSRRLKIPQGWGSPMTKLGTLLGQQRRWADAEAAFAEALAVRSRIFGASSSKVAETMLEYSQVMEKEGRIDEAKAMQRNAAEILAVSAGKEPNTPTVSLVVLLAALLFFWRKDQLLIQIARLMPVRRNEPRSPKTNQPGEPLLIIASLGLAALMDQVFAPES